MNILLIIVLFTGCAKEHSSDCGVKEGCTFRFVMLDENGNNVFRNIMNRIDLVVYDSNGNLVDNEGFLAEEVEYGVYEYTMPLAPGEYMAVCWGNVSQNSKMSGLDNLNTGYLETVSKSSGCPLYYAPSAKEPRNSVEKSVYAFTVEQNRFTIKELNFVIAHWTLKVYIQDVENMTGYDGGAILVGATNLPYKYDFFMNPYSDRMDYENKAEIRNGFGDATTFVSTIYIPIDEISENTYISIRNTAGEDMIEPLSLRKYVEENGIEYRTEVDILISFKKDTSVEVTLPEWGYVEMQPE